MPEEEDKKGFTSISNINYVQEKIKGVKELIMEKMFETLQRSF